MTKEMYNLLADLADVLEKHNGGLTTTTNDDGIYVTQNDDWSTKICIEYPFNGNVTRIREILDNV
jgi:hypothetical protein